MVPNYFGTVCRPLLRRNSVIHHRDFHCSRRVILEVGARSKRQRGFARRFLKTVLWWLTYLVVKGMPARGDPLGRKIQPAVGQLDFLRPGPAQPDPRHRDPNLVRDTLIVFLGNIIDGLYFHGKSQTKIIEKAVHMRNTVRERPYHRYDDIVMDLRDIFSKKEWTAIFIPSGLKESHAIDKLVTSKNFLLKLSRTIKSDPHLILHLNEAPQKDFAITDVYPPFQSALSKSPAGLESYFGTGGTNPCFSRCRRKKPRMPSIGYFPGRMTSRRHRDIS